jgi:CRP-like cAMP-binding protein
MARRNVGAARNWPLLRGFAPAVAAEILDAAAVRKLEAGELLFHQGEPVEALYVVEAGRLKLAQVTPDGAEVVVGTVGPGSILAGVAVLEQRILPVSAISVSSSRVLVWLRPRILELAVRHPLLRMNVVNFIADRMQQSLRRIRELATEHVDQRVARALLSLVRETGRAVENGTLIDQPLSRQELAELAGTSMYTASRLLARWAREGTLDVGRQRVVVRSLERLAELAGNGQGGSPERGVPE